MVARPPVRFAIGPMRLADLDAVQAIERASFTTPWPTHAYRSELETNRLAHYLVARVGDEVAAYGGMWLMVDEAHITTFAVAPRWRRRRVGERLLLAMLDLAHDRHAREATLEVRLSNLAARRLYEKYGFRPVGLRPRYYSDDNEDALIMTTEPLEGSAMRLRLDGLRGALAAEPAPGDEAAEAAADGRGEPADGGAKSDGADDDTAKIDGAGHDTAKSDGADDDTAKIDGADDDTAKSDGADDDTAKIDGAGYDTDPRAGADGRGAP